jgi:hypothetical protein
MGIKNWLSGEPSTDSSYEVTVVCTNCDHTVRVRIGHRKTVGSWGKTARCRVCKTTGHFEKSY